MAAIEEAERKRKRTEFTKEALQSMTRSSLVLPNAASVTPELECPVCHDLMLIPIQCRRGHSVCSHCAHLVAGTTGPAEAACPTCRGPINLTDTTVNFALQTMIDRLSCRCPNLLSTAGADSCSWRGTFEGLEAHLRACTSEPVPCPFARHGCKSVMRPAAMRLHQVEGATYHSELVADRFAAMEARMATIESTLTSRVAKVEAVNDALSQVSLAMPLSAAPAVGWVIEGAPSYSLSYLPDPMIKRFKSKRITIQVPGFGTTELGFVATFQYGTFGFEIRCPATANSTFSNRISISGTSVTMVNTNPGHQDVLRLVPAGVYLVPGSGHRSHWAWDNFCGDPRQFSYSSVTVNVKIVVNSNMVWV